jgi:hypothetical protein
MRTDAIEAFGIDEARSLWLKLATVALALSAETT